MATRRDKFRHLKITRAFLLAWLLVCAPAQADTTTENCLKLGADESLARFFSLFDKAISEVYARAGLCAISIPMSPKRIEQMVAAGTLDGDWVRVEGYLERFKQDLIAIPAPLFRLEAVLLSLEGSSFSGNPQDLTGRRVGYQAGFRWIEANLPLIGAHPVEIPAAMPIRDLLERGRFDVFATDGVRASFIRQSFADQPGRLRLHRWRKMSFFHLIHKRHADKVEILRQAFVDATADGVFDSVFSLPGIIRADSE